jgi:hypothetical protein
MSSTTKHTVSMTLATAALLAVVASPAALRAQSTLSPVTVTASQAAEANSLDERAVALYSSPKKWRKAAWLHEEAADRRSISDPRAHQSLIMAGHIYYAAGANGLAFEAMARGAERAAQIGDVVTAANAYVDAGLMAAEASRGDEIADMARRAVALANSPLLNDEERATIVKRVGYSEVAALAGAPVAEAP